MGLNAAYTGEDELDILMDDIHDNIGTIAADAGNALGDAQAGLLGLWAGFIGAVFAAQASAVATDRIADDVGPQTASMIMNIATQVNVLHAELIASSLITAAEMADTADPQANWTVLGPVH